MPAQRALFAAEDTSCLLRRWLAQARPSWPRYPELPPRGAPTFATLPRGGRRECRVDGTRTLQLRLEAHSGSAIYHAGRGRGQRGEQREAVLGQGLPCHTSGACTAILAHHSIILVLPSRSERDVDAVTAKRRLCYGIHMTL